MHRSIKFLLMNIPIMAVNAQAVFYSPDSAPSAFGQETQPLTAHTSIIALGNMFQGLLVFVGIGLLLLSLNKYFDHRKSPTYVPISSVISMIIAGLGLIGLGFIPMESV
tara:strand:+ start:3070 stop:3396 length:327 start_codon:yes stop_codon:yes gene_type:complete